MVSQPDGSCAVEVRRGAGSELVSGFAGKAEAEAWIAKRQAGKVGGRPHHQRFTRTAEERDDRLTPKSWFR